VTKVLPRKEQSEIEPTVFLRPKDPDDHKQFEELLPWFTPLFLYEMDNADWVRWVVPQSIGRRLGIPEDGCSCCGNKSVVEDGDSYLVDTAWHETDWWLEANGWAYPTKNPTEGKS
jgi:hypothetical protein